MSYCLMMGAEGCATQRGTQMEHEHGALGLQMSALQELQPKERVTKMSKVQRVSSKFQSDEVALGGANKAHGEIAVTCH